MSGLSDAAEGHFSRRLSAPRTSPAEHIDNRLPVCAEADKRDQDDIVLFNR